jgi:hypothetical protein
MARRRDAGGRGYRAGSDAWVGQQEEFARRAREIPRQDGWGLQNGLFFHDHGSTSGYDADTLLLVYSGRQRRDSRIKTARFYQNSVPAAPSVLQAAVYALVDKSFVRVPGSHFTFDFTSGPAGAAVDIDVDFLLQDGVHYFAAVRVDGNTASVQISTESNLRPARSSLVAGVPATLPLSSTGRHTGLQRVPVVLFLSKEAAEVL